MTTKDFLCVCLGVCSNKVDEICDNFMMDIDEGDVAYLLRCVQPKYSNFGQCLIEHLYCRIISDAVESFELDEDKFDYYVNGADSHMYYDGHTINSWKELEHAML